MWSIIMIFKYKFAKKNYKGIKQLVSSTIWMKCLDNQLFIFHILFSYSRWKCVNIVCFCYKLHVGSKDFAEAKKTGSSLIIFPELTSKQIILFISNLSKVVSVLKSYQLDSTFSLSKCCIQIQRLYNWVLPKK